MERGLPRPDIMLGDFNMTEDSIDRLPNDMDTWNTIEALGELKQLLQLTDGWRELNSEEKGYTHTVTADGSQARLDRIYATREVIESAQDWVIDDNPAALRSDHKMIRVDVTHREMPEIGRGRWTIPEYVLKDKKYQEQVVERGKQLSRELSTTAPRTNNGNAQTRYKEDVAKMARKRCQQMAPIMSAQIQKMKEEVQDTHNNQELTEEQRIQTAGILEEKIAKLEFRRFSKARKTSKIRDAIEGETIGKGWSKTSKERKPREVMYALKKPGTLIPEYETETHKMAEIARQHHHALLEEDLDTPEELRRQTMKEIFEQIPENQKMPTADKGKLAERIKEEEVREV